MGSGHVNCIDEDYDEDDDDDEDQGDRDGTNYDSGLRRALSLAAAIKTPAINLCRRHPSCNKSSKCASWHLDIVLKF